MDIQEYKCNGYSEVSLNLSQPMIDRAEREVTMAYVEPIISDVDTSVAIVKQTIMALAVLRIQQISIFATRSGAKEKSSTNSQSASANAVLQQYASVADLYLRKLRELDGANADAKVDDICRIYFTTNYFYN